MQHHPTPLQHHAGHSHCQWLVLSIANHRFLVPNQPPILRKIAPTYHHNHHNWFLSQCQSQQYQKQYPLMNLSSASILSRYCIQKHLEGMGRLIFLLIMFTLRIISWVYETTILLAHPNAQAWAAAYQLKWFDKIFVVLRFYIINNILLTSYLLHCS